MKTIKLTGYEGVKIGDTLNFYSTRDYTKIIKRKVCSFPLSNMNEFTIGIAFTIGNTRYQQLIRDILSLNPQIKEVGKEGVLKLYKNTGKDKNGFGDVDYHQWILECEGEEVSYSRLFSVDENQQPDWYYNEIRETLPKSTRQEVLNPLTKLVQ